jgi:prepilin-type N-terminal cleavage/methylation domain-containing protein
MKLTKYSHRQLRGFTLIELLTVIAIIGILAGIIIPTTAAVRKTAKKAQTKTQFSNWVTAMNLFKQEYGYFPMINRTAYATAAVNTIKPDAFAIALTGKKIDGQPVTGSPTTADLFGNKKRISFYSFSDSDLNAARTNVIDAFSNTDIVVIYDKDADGMITTADLDSGSSAPNVNGLTPATGLTATEGPRATVIFYSAGKGGDAGDIIYSWK